MRNLLFLLTFIFSTACFGAYLKAPFHPHVDARFNALESFASSGSYGNGFDLASAKIMVGNSSGKGAAVSMSGDATISNTGALTIAAGAVEESMLAVATADGLNAMRVARATLDCGVEDCSAGTVGMGVTIPAKAILLRAWYYTVTQFVDGGAGTVALQCEDSGNIDAAADITGITVGTITQTDLVAGAEVAAIAAACEISAVIATAEQTAGKLILYVEYVIAE